MTANQIKAAKIQNTKDFKAVNDYYKTAKELYKKDPKRGYSQPFTYYLGNKITAKDLKELETELKIITEYRKDLYKMKPTN